MNKKDFFLDLSKEEREIIVHKGTEPPLQENIMITLNQEFLFVV